MPTQFRLQNSKFKTVPWELVKDRAQRAWVNHSQSLETLSSRGGLGPEELYVLLRDEDLQVIRGVTHEHAEKYIEERLKLLAG